AEKGCIEYGATVDTDGGPFAKFGPDTFVVIEKWATMDDLKAHGAAEHMKAYAAKNKDLLADRNIHDLNNARDPTPTPPPTTATASAVCARRSILAGSSACVRPLSANSRHPDRITRTSQKAAPPGASSATCTCGNAIRSSAPPRSS